MEQIAIVLETAFDTEKEDFPLYSRAVIYDQLIPTVVVNILTHTIVLIMYFLLKNNIAFTVFYLTDLSRKRY